MIFLREIASRKIFLGAYLALKFQKKHKNEIIRRKIRAKNTRRYEKHARKKNQKKFHRSLRIRRSGVRVPSGAPAFASEQKCFGAFLLISLFSKRTNGGNHCGRRSPPLIRFENQKKACLYRVPGSGCSPAFPRPSIPAGRFLPMRVVLDGGVCCIPAAFEADHSTKEVNTSTGTTYSIFKVQRQKPPTISQRWGSGVP